MDITLFAFLVISGIIASGVHAVNLRYFNLYGDSKRTTTRDIFRLEVVLQSNETVHEDQVRWLAPDCRLSSTNSLITYLNCPNEGIHTISLFVNGIEVTMRSISFHKSYECYDWKIHIVQNDLLNETSPAEGSYQWLRVWIVGRSYDSSMERRGDADIPSELSMKLTKQFYILGQTPAVKCQLSLDSLSYICQPQLLGFNAAYGYWEFEMKSGDQPNQQLLYTVTGEPVAHYDCFVKDLNYLHPYKKYSISKANLSMYSITSKDTRSFMLLPDPCHSNIATVLIRGKLYLTQDDFQNVLPLPSPSNEDLEIISVAMMINYIVVLSGNGSLFYLHHSESSFKQYHAAEDFAATGISAQDWCVKGLFANQHDVDLLVMWNEDCIWLSDNLTAAKPLQIPVDLIKEVTEQKLLQYEIHDVSQDKYPGRLGLALKITVGTRAMVMFATYDIFSHEWKLSPFWADFTQLHIGRVTSFFPGLAKPSFYFRNPKSLFFSYDDGDSIGMKSLYNCKNITILASKSNYIRDVLVSKQGDISVLLNTNEILYGKVKQNELITLSAFYTHEDLSSLHWFDHLNRLWVISVLMNSTTRRIQYPLRDEIFSKTKEDCPYKHFSTNITEQLYRLDMGESLSFWILLVFTESKRNSIDVILEDPSQVIKMDRKLKYYKSEERISHNQTVTLAVSDQKTVSGLVAVEVRPHRSNLQCADPSYSLAYVSVGCRPGRHIRLNTDHLERYCKNNMSHWFYMYILNAGSWINLFTGHRSTQDKSVVFDSRVHGCPVVLDAQTQFLPSFDLYDNDTFIKSVEANYIVWEINGRTDYKYTITMDNVGCLREAQTWQEMRQLGHLNTSAEDQWGSHNYKSCFVYDGHAAAALHTDSMHELFYEILNKSGKNKIYFYSIEDAMYIFKAEIIDPTFSFCNLSTTFAVRIKGIKPQDDLNALATANYAMLAIILGVLFGTYVWFHRQTVKSRSSQAGDADAKEA